MVPLSMAAISRLVAVARPVLRNPSNSRIHPSLLICHGLDPPLPSRPSLAGLLACWLTRKPVGCRRRSLLASSQVTCPPH
jgi:hypothetical protein